MIFTVVLSLVLLVKTSFAQVTTYSCQTSSKCDGKVLSVTGAKTINVVCGSSKCDGMVIFCGSGSTCLINCSATGSCPNMRLFDGGASNLDLKLNGVIDYGTVSRSPILFCTTGTCVSSGHIAGGFPYRCSNGICPKVLDVAAGAHAVRGEFDAPAGAHAGPKDTVEPDGPPPPPPGAHAGPKESEDDDLKPPAAYAVPKNIGGQDDLTKTEPDVATRDPDAPPAHTGPKNIGNQGDLTKTEPETATRDPDAPPAHVGPAKKGLDGGSDITGPSGPSGGSGTIKGPATEPPGAHIFKGQSEFFKSMFGDHKGGVKKTSTKKGGVPAHIRVVRYQLVNDHGSHNQYTSDMFNSAINKFVMLMVLFMIFCFCLRFAKDFIKLPQLNPGYVLPGGENAPAKQPDLEQNKQVENCSVPRI